MVTCVHPGLPPPHSLVSARSGRVVTPAAASAAPPGRSSRSRNGTPRLRAPLATTPSTLLRTSHLASHRSNSPASPFATSSHPHASVLAYTTKASPVSHSPATATTSPTSPPHSSSSSPYPSSSSSSSSSPSPHRPLPPLIRDPLELVSRELSSLRSNVTMLLGSGHPSLDSIAKYYFQSEGKHIRPMIVLLVAKAVNGLSPVWSQIRGEEAAADAAATARAEAKETGMTTTTDSVAVERDMGIDEPLSPRGVLNDFNPHMEGVEGRGTAAAPTSPPATSTTTPSASASVDPAAAAAAAATADSVLPTQRRLAEITEMIHVASLLHDDVIDASDTRRGRPSAPAAFGNKLCILGGDFLLGRASVALARLRDNEVVELLATVIANLVEGEVMQLRSQQQQQQQQQRQQAGRGESERAATAGAAPAERKRRSDFSTFWTSSPPEAAPPSGAGAGTAANATMGPTQEMFEDYLQKTYLKTAALIGKSARAAAILGGFGVDAERRLRRHGGRRRSRRGDLAGGPAAAAAAGETAAAAAGPGRGGAEVEEEREEETMRSVRDAAYQYGRNLGIAFQLVDDLLDFQSTSAAFGKPSGGADLRLGLATAPVLYAWQERPASGLGDMVARRFEGEGDVEKALAIVNASSGLERTAQLARHYASLASEALNAFPPSEARDALAKLNEQVLSRIK